MSSILDMCDEYDHLRNQQMQLNYKLRKWSQDTNIPYLLIGITGPAKSGKDTAVNAFMNYLGTTSASSLAFADPIREIGTIFGFTNEQLTNQFMKETMDTFWNITPRKFMQLVGTELFRNNIDKDCWIKLASLRINKLIKHNPLTKVIFITDVRFENEVNFIKSHDGKNGNPLGVIFKINRPSLKNDSAMYAHASETYIDNIKLNGKYDACIENIYETVEEYKSLCDSFITTYLMRFIGEE